MTDKYNVILADPPWKYSSGRTGGERKKGATGKGGCEKHYPTMTNKELLQMSLFVRAMAAPQCVLFLWVTMPQIEFALKLMKAWGFKYKTNGFTWVKTTKDGNSFVYGPGGYTGSNVELCLIGIKGPYQKPAKGMMPSVITTPRLDKHSQKPDVHGAIEHLYPHVPKIELFARRPMFGWTVWGNEVA